MGYRVVDESSFTFRTDLPPSSRNIHPSGVLHGFRHTAPSSTLVSTNASGREEHTFAWIANSLHVDEAIKHLEKFGFDQTQGMVFIPYSTKQNWLDRYPHAAPALETNESGEVVVYLNWRPYPNGLGDLEGRDFGGDSATARKSNNEEDDLAGDEGNIKGSKEKKKRVHKSRALNILQDNTFLPDAERDELHVEIYNYLKWLHGKLSAIEEKANNSDAAAMAKSESEGLNESENAMDEDGNSKANDGVLQKKKNDVIPGVNVSKLSVVVTKMESTFLIIPNMKFEDETAGTGPQKGAPFLEEALSRALKKLVAVREREGKPKRRSRKRPRRKLDDPNNPRCRHSRAALDWDEMFQRLVKYKEDHGDTVVSKRYSDQLLANWVRGVRERWAKLVKAGKEVETVPEGEKVFAKTLTAERVAQLNSIAFTWSVAGPKTAWDDRFQELMEYYEMNGKWPTQSVGPLGLWVNKQRQKYKRREKSFMENGALKLDAVGFEWTPRGNTRMSWDEGLELLMEFGKENGHFNVPRPVGLYSDAKGDEYRLYNWVQSLHVMYRSYKLGRQSGSLTDDRVVLLIKHGFQFRDG